VLHVVVREHLETFLGTFRAQHGKGLPRYVEQELRRYLRCGVLAHGFLRVSCSSCRQEMLVAFSCKCRASCPSCGARRACAAAAHLVDEVLPEVGVRQWVLTTPPEVRHVLAVRPEALTAHARMFVEEIGRWQKEQARARGLVRRRDGRRHVRAAVQRDAAELRAPAHHRDRWRVHAHPVSSAYTPAVVLIEYMNSRSLSFSQLSARMAGTLGWVVTMLRPSSVHLKVALT
jgi:hypothetical protein